VTDGIERALDLAQEAAGDREVVLMGASVAQQYLRAGLVDELRIHLVPVLLGDGILLFDRGAGVRLEVADIVAAPGVTHLTYRVTR
jgi:dihydrofolate reductase